MNKMDKNRLKERARKKNSILAKNTDSKLNPILGFVPGFRQISIVEKHQEDGFTTDFAFVNLTDNS